MPSTSLLQETNRGAGHSESSTSTQTPKLVLPPAEPPSPLSPSFREREVPEGRSSLVSFLQPEQRPEPHRRIQQFFANHAADLQTYGTTKNLATLKRTLSQALNLPEEVDPNSIRIQFDLQTNNALRNNQILGHFILPGQTPREVSFSLSTDGTINLNGSTIDRNAVPINISRLTRGVSTLLPQETTIDNLRELARTHGGSFRVTELNRDGVRLFVVTTPTEMVSTRSVAVFASAPRAGIPGGEGESLRRLTIDGDPGGRRNGDLTIVANYNVPGSSPRRIGIHYNAQTLTNRTERWNYFIQAGLVPGGQNLGEGTLTVVPPSRP